MAKDPDFYLIDIDQYKSDGRFKPGSVPSNKGKKMNDEQKEKCSHTFFKPGHKMNDEQKEKCSHTFFKPGHLPHNTKQDGVITERRDKRGIPQLFIRIALGKWQYYKCYIYEQHYVPLQKGDVIRFVDGNTLNCSIGNLEKITQAENLKLNKILSQSKSKNK
jgi:hypothetical protein